jgi:hypothetical protein
VVLAVDAVEPRGSASIGQTIEARVEDEASRSVSQFTSLLGVQNVGKGHGCTPMGRVQAVSECVHSKVAHLIRLVEPAAAAAACLSLLPRSPRLLSAAASSSIRGVRVRVRRVGQAERERDRHGR